MPASWRNAGSSDNGFFGAEQVTSHWSNHNRMNKTLSHFFFAVEKKSNHDKKKKKLKNSRKRKHTNSQWLERDPALSRLRIHKLHLHVGRHSAPVASLGLHLVLNGANWIHSAEEVSWSDVSCVYKVRRLSDHTSVDPPVPFRPRLLSNTAVEAQPEFAHAYSPKYKWAPSKFPNLHSGSFTKHTPQYDGCPMMSK